MRESGSPFRTAALLALLGGSWVTIGPGLNALSVSGRAGWGVGPKGRVARLTAGP
jgi:hypothetical protein